MKIKYYFLVSLFAVLSFTGCQNAQEPIVEEVKVENEFKFLTEQFADIKIVRYQVPGFEELSAKEKELLYYLYEAALAGRDIMWDQNFKYNLTIRRTLEAIVQNYQGEKTSQDWMKLMEYTKRVWFSNGIHHHYSNDKFQPEFSKEFFENILKSIDSNLLPLNEGQSVDDLIKVISPIIFDETVYAKKVSLDPNKDLIAASSVNFYEGVTESDVENFYKNVVDVNENEPISHGLNSKLVKENGKIIEKTWKVGGMYSPAIEKIVYWLEKASTVAENENQKKSLDLLVEFYKTGDLKTFDDYNIAWVNDTNSRIDVVNGFIEVYNDPIGYRGSYESVVSIKDMEASKRIEAIGNQAQWFEDNSTIMDEHKKKNVQGISAKVITVVVESGDASPATPIGINLPNANWIRANHGSKSVNLGNIVYAYEMAAKGGGALNEFYLNEELVVRQKEHGGLADLLHTDLHEVIGHASGRINDGVGTPKETLKNYSSILEEARADLVALYYLMDEKLIELGVMSTLEVGKAAYDDYITNGMMQQLVRIKLGDDIEEAHMRNRQLIAKWCFEKGANENVIEKVVKEGKTYFVVNDYNKLRVLFGDLLREIQRIKSEGDYQAGKDLVENYGVKIDQDIHKEVLDRYAKLGVAPYGGFINPVLVPVYEGDKIVDVKIEYPDDFTTQMLYYAKNHSLLPHLN
jgi:dipeptidyl-peptidase III